jgi:hypothetical protein
LRALVPAGTLARAAMDQLLLHLLSALVIGPLGTQPAAILQAPSPDCGGYLPEAVRGAFTGLAPHWLDAGDRRALCGWGTAVDSLVTVKRLSRSRADSIWEALVVRHGFCAGAGVAAPARRHMEQWAGLPLPVAEKYCLETWDGGRRHTRVHDLPIRTAWLRRELFCEVATLQRAGAVAFLEPFVPEPGSMAALKALGAELCGQVRSGTLAVDDAFSRLSREETRARQRLPGEIAQASVKTYGQGIAWLAKVFAAVVAVVGTIVGILVGARRLMERGE